MSVLCITRRPTLLTYRPTLTTNISALSNTLVLFWFVLVLYFFLCVRVLFWSVPILIYMNLGRRYWNTPEYNYPTNLGMDPNGGNESCGWLWLFVGDRKITGIGWILIMNDPVSRTSNIEHHTVSVPTYREYSRLASLARRQQKNDGTRSTTCVHFDGVVDQSHTDCSDWMDMDTIMRHTQSQTQINFLLKQIIIFYLRRLHCMSYVCRC